MSETGSPEWALRELESLLSDDLRRRARRTVEGAMAMLRARGDKLTPAAIQSVVAKAQSAVEEDRSQRDGENQ